MTALEPGTRVRVRDDWPEARGPCHVRTPHYLRGHTVTIIRELGTFPDPGDGAFGRPAARRRLFHVTAPLATVWPEAEGGNASCVVEIYDNWLEAAP